MLTNRCDVHTHTLFSRHAYSTIRENVLAAAEQGVEVLGDTEHFSCMLFPEQRMRDFQFFFNFGAWPKVWEGVRLMHGCEADIVDLDGRLFGYDIPVDMEINGAPLAEATTLKERVFSDCDYVIASVHDRSFTRGSGTVAGTQMYLNALHDPKVLILGHIGRSGVDFDVREVVAEAARLGKLIEINAHSLEFKREAVTTSCRKIAETCAELGCKIAVSTDAHICCSIGKFEPALEVLDEIHFPQELIATTNAETFSAAMAAAGLGE